MEGETVPFEVKIVRTTTVRVTGAVDQAAGDRLERILLDLVLNHGIVDLVVDLSGAQDLGPEVAAVLAATRIQIEGIGGRIAVRAPFEPPAEMLDLAEDIETFVPVETHGHADRADPRNRGK